MDRGPGARFWQRILLCVVVASTLACSAWYAAGRLCDDVADSIPDTPAKSASEVLTLVAIGRSRFGRSPSVARDRKTSASDRPRNSSATVSTKRSRHPRHKLRRRVRVLPVARISSGRFLVEQPAERISDTSLHRTVRSNLGPRFDSLRTFVIQAEFRSPDALLPKWSPSGDVALTVPKSAPRQGGSSESGVQDRKLPSPPKNQTAQRRLPQALIIGVKKGGTRALLEFIRLHPDVRAAGPETHFFDRHYHKGLEWYRSQMPPTLEGQLTMEKTPSYFVTREVPRRIRSMAHDVKLLVVVRDPVTRAISDYAQTVSKRRHMKSFDELTFVNNATGLVDTSWGAIRIGVYAKHLEHWLQYFPLRQFHFVSGERLIKDPAGEMAKVQDFLQVRRIVTEAHFYFNETKGFPCVKKAEGGGGKPRCLGKTKGRTHPNVDNSTIQNLREFFRPFNLKFYQMTGVDFGWP